MLTQEDVVEIHALRKRGWSVAAIARHTGRDPKTIRRHLAGWKPNRGSSPSPLEPYRPYLEAHFGDDPHVFATVLHRELVELGFERSYRPTVEVGLRLGRRQDRRRVGSIQSQGYNAESHNTCGFQVSAPRFDLIRTDPQLLTLADNGGPTLTLALRRVP